MEEKPAPSVELPTTPIADPVLGEPMRPGQRPGATSGSSDRLVAAGGLPDEVRAIWVVRESLADTLPPDRIPHIAHQLGANTLFVQISGRGDAWYRSDILPRAEPLGAGSDDPFQSLLDAARDLGLSVHAWVNVGLVWSSPDPPKDPRHLVHAHPEWLQHFPDGEPMTSVPRDSLHAWWVEGLFAEVADPEYRAHVAAVAREILDRYPVDGIHLDYIRRPIIDTGYDEATLADFEEQTRYETAEIRPDPDPEIGARAWRWPDYSDSVQTSPARAWNWYRRDAVTSAVAAVREVVNAAEEAREAPVLLTAAVIPEPDRARRRFAQDWPEWLRSGLIDYAVPMCYRQGRAKAETALVAVLGEAEPERVIVGIATYNQPLGEAALSLRRMLTYDVRGVCVFSWGALEAKGFQGGRLLRRAWWPEWAQSPLGEREAAWEGLPVGGGSASMER